MTLFATGIGEAADGCAFLLVFGALAVVVVAAVSGGTRGSASLVALSFLLAGFVGALVVPEAIAHELRDTADSRGVHAMLWQFVWWWAASLCVPLGASVALVLRGSASGADSTQSVPAREADENESAEDHRGPIRQGPWAARLLTVGLLLLAMLLLATLN